MHLTVLLALGLTACAPVELSNASGELTYPVEGDGDNTAQNLEDEMVNDAPANEVANSAAGAADQSDLWPTQTIAARTGKCDRASWIAPPPEGKRSRRRFRCFMETITYLAKRAGHSDTIVAFYPKAKRAMRISLYGAWENRNQLVIKRLGWGDQELIAVQGLCTGDFDRPPEAYFAEGLQTMDSVAGALANSGPAQEREAEQVKTMMCDISDMQDKLIVSVRFVPKAK